MAPVVRSSHSDSPGTENPAILLQLVQSYCCYLTRGHKSYKLSQTSAKPSFVQHEH